MRKPKIVCPLQWLSPPETVDFSIVDYENELVEAGMEHMAPIFIYLDQGVRAEVCRTNRDVH